MDRCHQAKGRSWLLLFVCGVVLLLPLLCEGACNFPAIFNFGDSSSDTGTLHFIFPDNIEAENPPYGRTFFGHPVNRYSDGRVSVDFFASALGLPFLDPYTQSVGANFAHGANFAAAGATVQSVTFIAPISLPVQINQFHVFKQQVLATIKKNGDKGDLPTEDVFRKAIYILDIGGNDISYGYVIKHLSPEEIKQDMLPTVVSGVADAVEKLYNEGASTILVRDVGPQGCQPFWITSFSQSSTDFDKNGCSIPYNDAVRYYNNLLRSQVADLRAKLKGANIVYVNAYDILYDFFVNPSQYGFTQTIRACCGVGGGKYNYMSSIECAHTGTLNGQTVKADSCPDPASYVNWDGVHWTDQANRFLIKTILEGNHFEPAFSIASQCDVQPL
uniref:TSA: Wollemia nobilis Ref_Wollemi_Transcript_13171_1647 transcribed RNA sequence n=1 Tax=Wollemia nobilis TaxID=56998 RepID=A0A0C9RKU9_9CONI